MPCNCNSEFRFDDSNFDFLTLNPRDFSLVEMGIRLGSSLQLETDRKRIRKYIRIIDELVYLNKGLSQRYGKTPWSGERG